MKKFIAGLVSLVAVGNSFSLNQALAKDPYEAGTSTKYFNYLLTEDKDTLKLNESFEKQKSKSEQKMDFIYLNEDADEKETNTNKKENIESKTKEAKEGIFSKISSKIAKSFSSVIGFCKSRILKTAEKILRGDPFVEEMTRNTLETVKDLKTTENYNIALFEKTDKNIEEFIAFYKKVDEESKKPGNDILQCFFNAILSEEFKNFPLLKVTNKEGKVVGYIRIFNRFTQVEFIPFFLDKHEAKQALVEVILSFKELLKEKKTENEEKLKEVWEHKKKEAFFGFGYSDKILNNYLEMLKSEIILVPFGRESKSVLDYGAFLKEVVENVKKDFSKVIATNTIENDGSKVYRLIP